MACSHRQRDETRQFGLVSNCVHTANLTRQDSFVSSASVVWTNHYGTVFSSLSVHRNAKCVCHLWFKELLTYLLAY